MLQEEVRKLHLALNEERKVTEKLSRNLELEKRRSESLEQKAKNAFRRSGASSTNSFLPEDMRFRDEDLHDKMEKYRDQLERLMQSLQECEEKLTGFEIQEEYHAADLRKELVNLRKVLGDEKRRSNSDSTKLNELQNLLGKPRLISERRLKIKMTDVFFLEIFAPKSLFIFRCCFQILQ